MDFNICMRQTNCKSINISLNRVYFAEQSERNLQKIAPVEVRPTVNGIQDSTEQNLNHLSIDVEATTLLLIQIERIFDAFITRIDAFDVYEILNSKEPKRTLIQKTILENEKTNIKILYISYEDKRYNQLLTEKIQRLSEKYKSDNTYQLISERYKNVSDTTKYPTKEKYVEGFSSPVKEKMQKHYEKNQEIAVVEKNHFENLPQFKDLIEAMRFAKRKSIEKPMKFLEMLNLVNAKYPDLDTKQQWVRDMLEVACGCKNSLPNTRESGDLLSFIDALTNEVIDNAKNIILDYQSFGEEDWDFEKQKKMMDLLDANGQYDQEKVLDFIITNLDLTDEMLSKVNQAKLSNELIKFANSINFSDQQKYQAVLKIALSGGYNISTNPEYFNIENKAFNDTGLSILYRLFALKIPKNAITNLIASFNSNHNFDEGTVLAAQKTKFLSGIDHFGSDWKALGNNEDIIQWYNRNNYTSYSPKLLNDKEIQRAIENVQAPEIKIDQAKTLIDNYIILYSSSIVELLLNPRATKPTGYDEFCKQIRLTEDKKYTKPRVHPSTAKALHTYFYEKLYIEYRVKNTDKNENDFKAAVSTLFPKANFAQIDFNAQESEIASRISQAQQSYQESQIEEQEVLENTTSIFNIDSIEKYLIQNGEFTEVIYKILHINNVKDFRKGFEAAPYINKMLVISLVNIENNEKLLPFSTQITRASLIQMFGSDLSMLLDTLSEFGDKANYDRLLQEYKKSVQKLNTDIKFEMIDEKVGGLEDLLNALNVSFENFDIKMFQNLFEYSNGRLYCKDSIPDFYKKFVEKLGFENVYQTQILDGLSAENIQLGNLIHGRLDQIYNYFYKDENLLQNQSFINLTNLNTENREAIDISYEALQTSFGEVMAKVIPQLLSGNALPDAQKRAIGKLEEIAKTQTGKELITTRIAQMMIISPFVKHPNAKDVTTFEDSEIDLAEEAKQAELIRNLTITQTVQEQIYLDSIMQNRESRIDESVDFSAFTNLASEEIFERFAYSITGGTYFTSDIGQKLYGDAKELIIAGRSGGRKDRIGFGDFALYTWYGKKERSDTTKFIDPNPISAFDAKEKFKREFAILENLSELSKNNTNPKYIQLSRQIALKYGSNQAEQKTLLRELLRGEIPAKIKQEILSMREFLIASSIIIDAIRSANMQTGMEILASKNENLKKGSFETNEEYFEVMEVLQSQYEIFLKRDHLKNDNQYKDWYEYWEQNGLIPSLISISGKLGIRIETQKIKDGEFPPELARKLLEFKEEKYRLEDLLQNTEKDDLIRFIQTAPIEYIDKRYSIDTLPETTRVLGPYKEQQIIQNFPAVERGENIQNHETVYLGQETQNEFLRLLSRNGVDAKTINKFKKQPEEILKAIYALLGPDELKSNPLKYFNKFNRNGKFVPTLLLEEKNLETLILDNIQFFQSINWQKPTLREILSKNEGKGVVDLDYQEDNSSYIKFDQSLQATALIKTLQEKSAQIKMDTLMSFSIMLFEMSGNKTSEIDRNNPEENIPSTDPFEISVSRKSQIDIYEATNNQEKYIQRLIDQGQTAMSILTAYPENFEYDQLFTEEEFTGIDEIKNILYQEGKFDPSQINSLTGNQLVILAKTIQLGILFEQQIIKVKNEQIASIEKFENRSTNTSIADLLRVTVSAYASNGQSLTATEINTIGQNIATQINTGSITEIKLSKIAYEISGDYKNFRKLIAVASTENKDKLVSLFNSRLANFLAPFTDIQNFNAVANDYIEFKVQSNELKKLRFAQEYYTLEKRIYNANNPLVKQQLTRRKDYLKKRYANEINNANRINEKIKQLNEKYKEFPHPFQTFEKVLVNDFESLITYATLEMEIEKSKRFFAGIGMNIPLDKARAPELAFNIGIRNENITINGIAIISPAGPEIGFGIEASNPQQMDERLSPSKVYFRVSGKPIEATLKGTLGLELGTLSPKGTQVTNLGAFVRGQISPEESSIMGGAYLEHSLVSSYDSYETQSTKLSEERESELIYQKAEIENAINSHPEFTSENSVTKSILAEQILQRLILMNSTISESEAGSNTMPNKFKFSGFIMGASAGISTRGIPVQAFLGVKFVMNGETFYSPIISPEYQIDGASDAQMMDQIAGLRSGRINRITPIVINGMNFLSAQRAREITSRNQTTISRANLYYAGSAGELVRNADGQVAIAQSVSSSIAVGIPSFEQFQKEHSEKFNNNLQQYNIDIHNAGVSFEKTGDSFYANMQLEKTVGAIEIHTDPQSENLIQIVDGKIRFDLSGGFPIITNETIHYAGKNNDTHTLNIFTIRFNKNLSRTDIEHSEKKFIYIASNSETLEAKPVEIKTVQPYSLDSSMIERAQGLGEEAIKQMHESLVQLENLLTTARTNTEKNIGSSRIANESDLEPSRISEIEIMVASFVPNENLNAYQGTKKTEMTNRRKMIEIYFTISNPTATDEAAYKTLIDAMDSNMIDAKREFETLIVAIQEFAKTKNNGNKLTATELQFFLSRMIFRTFYNIHQGSYESTDYFHETTDVMDKSKNITQIGRQRLQSTMKRYLEHLDGSATAMANQIAKNFKQRNTNIQISESDLSAMLMAPVKDDIISLLEINLSSNFANSQSEKPNPEVIYNSLKAGDLNMSDQRIAKAVYETYSTIFSPTGQTADAQILEDLNPAFASARHLNLSGNEYVSGGRAVEAISTEFGGLRRVFLYKMFEPQRAGETPTDYEKRMTIAKMIQEYMSPLPEVKDDENGIPLNIVKDYFSNSLGLQVVENAYLYMNKNDAEKLQTLFGFVNNITYEDITKLRTDSNPNGDKLVSNKDVFLKFVDLVKLFREIATRPSTSPLDFEHNGTASKFEVQIRYMPVENIETGANRMGSDLTKLLTTNNQNLQEIINEIAEKYLDAKPNEFTDTNALLKAILKKYTQLNDTTINTSILNDDKAVEKTIKAVGKANSIPLTSQIEMEGRQVLPIAFIFPSDSPDRVMMVNIANIASIMTFAKCGNWSVGFKESLANFYLTNETANLDAGTKGARTTSIETRDAEVGTRFESGFLGASFGGTIRNIPGIDLAPPEDKKAQDANTGISESGENPGGLRPAGDDTGNPDRTNQSGDPTDTDSRVELSDSTVGITTGSEFTADMPRGIEFPIIKRKRK